MTAVPAQLFSVAPGSPEPLYQQLMNQVRRLAASGQLAPGDEMPSVRELAQVLALNPMTVSKAYGLLELEGALVRRRGQGMSVAPRAPQATGEAERLRLLRPALERVVAEARQLELTPHQAADLLLQLFEESR